MAQNARRQSLIFPREHGAWGILLVPLVTGASVGALSGGRLLPLGPLSITALSLFWLRTPVESWVGAGPIRARTPAEFALVRKTSAGLAAVALAALAWLFWGGQNLTLLAIGAAAGAAFVAQALVADRTASQIIGAAGLTSLAAAAYYASTARLDPTAYALWTANFLFACNQIQYVHLRIRARVLEPGAKFEAGRVFLAGQVGLMLILAGASTLQLLSWWASAAFLPLLWRGFAWFARPSAPLAIHALGKQELFHAIAFGLLLIVGFRI